MYVKKLAMIGFKSFAESTTVVFQPGITAIVGPNGCGKSNIVDAILWVLGEQSTKTLRSDRMEDVIFNGSETRRPLNLCEAILTVGDVSGEVAGQFGDYQEIAITRRLFRTGESEYLINKIPCRLKDIRDLLIDTGAGHKGHTIIEQGKVDQLLNASPLERRELIEETAGISKYKLRKAEAERKLEATQQNLLRVSDIVGEVKRQINALDRQVKKTQTYQSLQAEARGLELNLLVSEYRTHEATLSDVLRQMAELKTTESSLLADLARTQAELETMKAGLAQKEQSLSSLKQEVYETQTLIQRQENRIELLRSQIHSWEEQRVKLGQEQSRLEQSLTQSVAEQEATQRQHEEVTAALSERQGRLNAQEAALNELDGALARHQTALEEAKTRLFEIMAAMTEVKNQTAALESRKKEILRIQEKGRSELSTVEQQIELTRAALQFERSTFAALTEELNRLETEQSRLAGAQIDKQAALEALGEQVLRQREALALAQARLASLRESEKSLTLSQAGILAWLSERPELRSRLHGIVADLLEVPKALEPAIEAVLGDQLQGLLIDDHTTIKEIIHSLKSAQLGRGVFLPRIPRLTRTAQVHSPGEEFDGFIGPALHQVKVKPGFEAAAQALLGDVLLVRDLEAALTLWSRIRIGYMIVTLEGEVLTPSGLLWAGRRTGSQQGLLLTRREIREAEEQIRQLESELARSEAEKAALATELERLQQQQQELIGHRQQEESNMTSQRQKIALLEADLARIEERRNLVQSEFHQEAREAGTVELSLAESLRQLEADHRKQEQIESELARLQEMTKDFFEKRESLRSEVTQLKVDVSSKLQRQETLSREQLRLQNEQISIRKQLERQTTEVMNLESKGQASLQDIRETETAIGTLSAKLLEIQEHLTVQTESYTADLGRIKQLEAQEGQTRTELGRVEKLLNEFEVRQTELKLRVMHLAEQASTHYQTPLEAATEPQTEPVDTAAVQERLTEIRTKLEELGPVNLAAIEEYKELEERHRFLTTQETDLRQSMEDLRTAIAKINRTTKEMFLSAYTALREKFKEVFQSFFVGGQADLVLLDEQNPLESGIEIVAQPPGKRLKSITLLSGGEKALTAIALLFSSFLIHPSPFCVLDEIDAPLDEENIRRFLKVLRQMTDHSQFLIITHNKRTMEHADLLYGVTMQEAGVSKLVSVKIESAGNGHAPEPSNPISVEPSTALTT